MDQFNLFEPDLELGRSLIPYGDMEIQGVWPRKQRTPSDVFPTNAALIGRGPNNDARWCATDKDGILLTNPGSGGSGGAKDITCNQSFNDYCLTQHSNPTSERPLPDVPTFIGGFIYSAQVTLSTVVPTGFGRIDLLLDGIQSRNSYYLGGFYFPIDFNSGSAFVPPICCSAQVNFDVSQIFKLDTEVDWHLTCDSGDLNSSFTIFYRV